MIQGVREVFEIVDVEDGAARRERSAAVEGSGKLVFIGRGLDEAAFRESLASCSGGG